MNALEKYAATNKLVTALKAYRDAVTGRAVAGVEKDLAKSRGFEDWLKYQRGFRASDAAKGGSTFVPEASSKIPHARLEAMRDALTKAQAESKVLEGSLKRAKKGRSMAQVGTAIGVGAPLAVGATVLAKRLIRLRRAREAAVALKKKRLVGGALGAGGLMTLLASQLGPEAIK